MGTIRRQMISNSLKLFDLLLIVLSFGLPVLIKVGLPTFTQFLEIRIKLRDFLVFSLLLLVWNFIFQTLGLYDSKRLSSSLAEAADVIKATSLATLVVVLVAFLLKVGMINPGFAVIFWLLATTSAAGSRLVFRMWLRRIRKQGRNSRNLLIVGTNRRAIEFAKTIQSQPELGYKSIGFSDEDWAGSRELSAHGFPLLCDLATLPAFLRSNVVDELVLALPFRSFHSYASEIAGMCEQQGVILRLLSDLFNLKNIRSTTEEVGGTTSITHHTTVMDGWPIVAKRILDVIIALALLTVLTPLLLVVAVLIKLTSAGPVLFVQKRVGLNKRTFNIHKFRTMVVDAEHKLHDIEHLNEVSGPVFKIMNDPRLTPIGKFLRKTSIDELPQLFDVLKGDMSLVGPRPLQMRDYQLFSECCEDWQRCRFSVPPGITCLWQIKGRSLLPFEKWMELDLQYVRKWSFWLDIKILAKTVPAILKGSGAA